MWHWVGFLSLLSINIATGYFLFTKHKIRYTILMTVGSIMVYGFWSMAFAFGARYQSPLLIIVPVAFASFIPFLVYIIKKSNRKRNPATTFSSNSRQNRQSTTAFEVDTESKEGDGKSEPGFWDNPRYSHAQGKLVLLFIGIVLVILYNIYTWIASLF